MLLAIDAGTSSKLCSRGDWMTVDDSSPGARIMRNIMAKLRSLPDLKDADRLAVFELAYALSGGILEAALEHIQKYWQSPAQLMFYRDVLQYVLTEEGIDEIDICPTQPFRVRSHRGHIVEAVAILIRHHPTGLAIGMPSHPELPPQVFRFVDFPDGSGVMEPELKANPAAVFPEFASAFIEAEQQELAS